MGLQSYLDKTRRIARPEPSAPCCSLSWSADESATSSLTPSPLSPDVCAVRGFWPVSLSAILKLGLSCPPPLLEVLALSQLDDHMASSQLVSHLNLPPTACPSLGFQNYHPKIHSKHTFSCFFPSSHCPEQEYRILIDVRHKAVRSQKSLRNTGLEMSSVDLFTVEILRDSDLLMCL